MSGSMGFSNEANIQPIDFQFLFRPDGRVVLGSAMVARFEVITSFILGQDFEREFIIHDCQYDLTG